MSRAGINLRRAALVTAALVSGAACASDKAAVNGASSGEMPVWTYSTRSDEARKRADAGERFSDDGQGYRAYEQFKRAIVADSAFAYAYLRAAQTALSPDDYVVNMGRAEAFASTANAVEVLLIKAERKAMDNDLEGSAELLKELTQKEPRNPRSFYLLGVRQNFNGQFAECRISFQKAMELAPNPAILSLNLGSSYVFDEPKDFAKAEQYITSGVKLAPRSPLSHFLLGGLRRAQNRLPEAAAAYSDMIALDPRESQGYGYRGNAYIFQGKFDKGRADWDEAIRLSRPSELANATINRPFINAYAGNIDAAYTEADQLVKAYDGMGVPDPDYAKFGVYDYLIFLAAYHHRFDVADRAMAGLSESVTRSFSKSGAAGVKVAGQAQILAHEGLIAVFKGDYTRTEHIANDIVKLRAEDRDPTKDWPVHGLRGLSALFQKKYALAITEFDGADPAHDQLVAYHKALALEGAGRSAEARALFQSVATYNFFSGQTVAVRNDAIAKVASMK